MKNKLLEKTFGVGFFVVLNLFIILTVELTGEYFYNTGILHALALFFVLLAVLRIFVHYRTYDQFLDKIKNASIVALFIFAISHVVEYINFIIFHRYDDAVFATTINFYLIGLASIVIGAELFFIKYDNRSNILVKILYLFLIALAVLNIAISFNHRLVSLEMGSAIPYVYLLASVSLIVTGINKLLKLKRKVPVSAGFLNYLMGSILFLSIAIFTNIFYEALEHIFGIPMFQIMYISHFAFFVSLSLMFLSYKKLANLPGIYSEAK